MTANDVASLDATILMVATFRLLALVRPISLSGAPWTRIELNRSEPAACVENAHQASCASPKSVNKFNNVEYIEYLNYISIVATACGPNCSTATKNQYQLLTGLCSYRIWFLLAFSLSISLPTLRRSCDLFFHSRNWIFRRNIKICSSTTFSLLILCVAVAALCICLRFVQMRTRPNVQRQPLVSI